MTDHPATAPRRQPRLTDQELEELLKDARRGQQAPSSDPSAYTSDDAVEAAALELREARALIVALKAEGCPVEADHSGNYYWCAWCHAELELLPGNASRGSHRPMEDGGPCLWERILSL